MIHRTTIVGVILFSVCVLRLAAAEGDIGTVPVVPSAGRPFVVLHHKDVAEASVQAAGAPPSGVKYDWKVVAKVGENEISAEERGVPVALPGEPKLTVTKGKPGATYTFDLTRTMASGDKSEHRLVVVFGKEGEAATFPLKEAETAAAEKKAQAEKDEKKKAEEDKKKLEEENKKLADDKKKAEDEKKKLEDGNKKAEEDKKKAEEDKKKGTEALTAVPNADDLVVSLDFIRAEITKGQPSLWVLIKDATQGSNALLAAMNKASQLSEGKSNDAVLEIWHTQLKAFKQEIFNGGVDDDEYRAWEKFVDAWEKEALNKGGPERFREALQQSGPIILAVIMKLDKEHIEAALKVGNTVSKSSLSSGSGGGGADSLYFHHHAHMPFLRMKVRRIDEMKRMRAHLQQ